MPKKLKVHPNERVDLPDFARAANDYTESSLGAENTSLVQNRRPLLLDGFRIEIPNQTSYPGQIIVYNGRALDRSGRMLSDEEQLNTSKTITLSGAAMSFYVEVEFAESASDTDARGFWDPTFDQADPIPDGAEVKVNVATRTTPDWTLRASTTPFATLSDLSSNRIPLAMINTNGANQITPAVNPSWTAVAASTILDELAAPGVSDIRVNDSRILAVGQVITVGFGGATPDAARTISAIDYANDLVSFAPPLANLHSFGAIVRVTSGSTTFVGQRVKPTYGLVTYSFPSSPDVAMRLWQGSEWSGAGLVSSSATYGARTDNNVRTLKDYVDVLAAEIRELKFGSMDPTATSTAPPAAFSAEPRWYENAGSVTGARSATVTIGNGTTSFGDFNGTDETTFANAVAALPASGGTVFVKPGTYTFAASVTLTNKSVSFVGSHRATTVVCNVAGAASFIVTGATSDVSFKGLVFSNNGATKAQALSIRNGRTTVDDCVVYGHVEAGHAGSSATQLYVNNTYIYARDAKPCLWNSGALGIQGSVTNCFLNTETSTLATDVCVSGNFGNGTSSALSHAFTFSNCVFSGETGRCYRVGNIATSSGLLFDACFFEAKRLFVFTSGNHIGINNCVADLSTDTVGLSYLLLDGCSRVTISSLIVRSQVSIATTDASYAAVIGLANACTDITISACQFVNVGGVDYTTAISTREATSVSGLLVTDCIFRGHFRALAIDGTTGLTSSRAIFADNKVCFDSIAFTSCAGVFLGTNNPADCNLTVSGCIFSTSNAATATAYALYAVSTGAGQVTFTNNSVLDILALGLSCVYVSGNSLTLSCTANTFRTITAGGGSAICVEVGSSREAAVTGNLFYSVTGSINATGISIGTAITAVVSNNVMRLITGTAGDGYGVYSAATERLTITGNFIRSFSGAGVLTAGILVLGVTELCTITGNSVDGTGGVTAVFGVGVTYDNNASLTISSNNIVLPSWVTYGVRVAPLGVDALRSCVIQGNSITGLGKAAGAYGVVVDGNGGAGGGSIVIANNSIVETVYQTLNGGIYVRGTYSHVAVTGNVITGLNTAAARGSSGAIYIEAVSYATIACNVVSWNIGGAASGPDITTISVLQPSITGNTISAHTGVLARILDAGATTFASAAANNIGQGAPLEGLTTAATFVTAGTYDANRNKTR